MVEGPLKGTTYDVEDACVLGRALDCQVHIQDLTVSRRHARVSRLNGRYVLEDLGSGNGTFVNEVPVSRHILSPGDVIGVSNLRLRFDEIETTGVMTDSVTMVGHVETQPKILKTFDAQRFPFEVETHKAVSQGELQRLSSRLRTAYAVSEAIANLLELDQLLPEILNKLFEVFPGTDRAFVMLEDPPGSGNLVPRAVKRKRENDQGEIQVSKTILNDVIRHRHAVLSRDAMADDRFLSGLSVANFGIRSMMCAPLLFRGEVLGVVYLDSLTFGTFAEADLELLSALAVQSAVAVGNARLHGELLKRQRLQQDLQVAERIQQSFLPRRVPRLPGYEFSARWDPAYEVGGDFYDFIPLPSDRLGVVVGDVSGKGVSAALYMARLTRDMRYFALSQREPARVLRLLNAGVLESGQDDLFVTLLYAVLDVRSGRVTLANAGHMPAVVRHQTEGSLSVFDEVSGLPLGVLPDTSYESVDYTLQGGDTLFLFTDGLVEAQNARSEMFGMDRLLAALREGRADASALQERAVSAVQKFVGDASQVDDTTIVCLSREDDTADLPSLRRTIPPAP